MSIHAPTIPTGRAARAAWRALPRRTRAEVIRSARHGWPHPDLDVSRIAVGWARPARLRRQRILPLLYLPLLAQSAIPLDALPERYRQTAIQAKGVLLLAVLAVVALSLIHGIRDRYAAKVEATNLRALIAADRAAPSALTVHGPGRFGLLDLLAVAYLVFLAGFAMQSLALRRMATQESPPPEIPPDAQGYVEFDFTFAFVPLSVLIAFLAFVVIPAILAVPLTLRPRGAGPLATVDAEGLTLPHLRLTLRWHEIASVDVAFPAPGDRWSYTIGLWILPRDPAVILARSGLPRWRQLPLSLWLSVFNRALYLPDSWLREPPETVVTAARRWLRATDDASRAD